MNATDGAGAGMGHGADPDGGAGSLGRPGRSEIPGGSRRSELGAVEAKAPAAPGVEPCLRCGVPIRLRQRGCRGGHCPNCGHPYPHGDCSD